MAGDYYALLLTRTDPRAEPIARITARTSKEGDYLRATSGDGASIPLISVEQAARFVMTVARTPPADRDLITVQAASRWRVRLIGTKINSVQLYAEE